MSQAGNLSDSFIFPKGRPADPRNFKGEAWVEELIADDTASDCRIVNVTFAPGALNSWHKHPGGQILLVTAGLGWYQEEGKPARKIQAGDVVQIPADTRHWHGADAANRLVHIAIGTNSHLGATQWLAPVSDEEYGKLG